MEWPRLSLQVNIPPWLEIIFRFKNIQITGERICQTSFTPWHDMTINYSMQIEKPHNIIKGIITFCLIFSMGVLKQCSCVTKSQGSYE